MELPTVTGILSEQLRNEILVGKLAPREKINEIKLAKELNVSRSPLREVFRMMENERLVENIPRRGTFVTNVSPEDFMEIYELREMIECRAIDIFERNSVRELPLVEKAFERENHIVLPSSESLPLDYLTYYAEMFDFHLKFVESAGNTRLFEIYKSLHSNVLRYHSQYTPKSKSKIRERATDHLDILEFIKTGDYEKARRIIKAHLKVHSDYIIENLSERSEVQ